MQKFTTTFIFTFLFLFSFHVCAQAPAGYYDAADGKSAAELKTKLFEIIHNYISADYDGFTAMYWGNTYFKQTDWNSNGYYWDMYSNVQRSTYNSSEMSREHCMPRSWWGTSTDYGVANSDLHNLYPADYTANSKKSNYPLGEVGSASWTNGSSALGPNTYSGYLGTVFEPADEYKGDFARTYFYMVTCHEDYANRWKDDGLASMLDNNTYPVFKDWAISLLLKWARQDPVSQKEIDRNNAVFAIQQNRNPFIDYPDLFEYVWGNKTGVNFVATNMTFTPALLTPQDETAVNFGSIQKGNTKIKSVPLRSVNLSGNVEFEWLQNSSGFFSLDLTSIDASSSNLSSGTTFNITFQPTGVGSYTAKLKVTNTDSGLTSYVNVSGTASENTSVEPVIPNEDEDVIFFYTGPWDKTSLPTYFATNAKSGPYGNGDFSFRANGEYLTITLDESPDYMRFAMFPRNSWATNNNHLYVFEGTSLENMETTPIADFDNVFMSVGDSYNNSPAIPLKEDTRAIKILYSKVLQNLGVNNLFVTRRYASGIIDSGESNGIYVSGKNGYVYVSGVEQPVWLEVYNLYGMLVRKERVSEANAAFALPSRGIYITKIGAKVQKITSE